MTQEENIEEINKRMQIHDDADNLRFGRIERALFGNGNGDKGMKQEMSEVHEFILGAQISARVVKWLSERLSA